MIDQVYERYNIILCGTGATGSHLVSFLTQLTAYEDRCNLIFIDGDRVEMKNLRNQKFLAGDDGLPKSRVLQRRYSRIYKDLPIRFIDEYIKDENQINNLLSDERHTLNILLGCVDNNPTRKILHSVFHSATTYNLMYIDSGNGTESMQGQIVVGYRKSDAIVTYNKKDFCNIITSIYAPCAGDIFPDIQTDVETVDHVTSCGYVADKNPQNIATNIMAASTVFSIINQAICFDNIKTGITYFDAKNQNVVYREVISKEENDVRIYLGIEAEKVRPDLYLTIDDIVISLKNDFKVGEHNIEAGTSIHLDFGEQDPNLNDSTVNIRLKECTASVDLGNALNVSFSPDLILPYLKEATIDVIVPYVDYINNTDDDENFIWNPKVTHIGYKLNAGDELFEWSKEDISIEQYNEQGHFILFNDKGELMHG